MVRNSAENPHDMLGVPEGASADLIRGAFIRKERILNKRKSDGQLGKGPLVPENDFERLRQARAALLVNEIPEDEIPTNRLVETQAMKDYKILNEIIVDERCRGIFAFLVKDQFDTNLPLSSDDVKNFHEVYKSEDEYNSKTATLYHQILNDPKLDRESRHDKWEKYVQAGIRLRNLLFTQD